MNKNRDEIFDAGKGRESLLPLLKEAQDNCGYLPQELMVELAKRFALPIADVYGVATFYSFLATKPQGRNVIKVCKSMPCYLKESQTIIETVEKELGIAPGETTTDEKFSLQLTNCIGVCDGAPAMMINDEAYVNLTPKKISEILKSFK